MAPKILPVLIFLLCAFVLISSRVQVTAEEPTAADEQKSKVANAAAGDSVDESKQVHGCRHGCCSWFRGRCVRCCPPKTTTTDAGVGDNKQLHGCDHGCCSWFRERCVRCCPPRAAAEAVVGENKNHRPPCRCCSYFRRRCTRCCAEGEAASAGEEAAKAEPHN